MESEGHSRDWNLIIDREPLKGSWNMAVDDYLFRSLGEEPRTYLRFYRWKRPTASIGYSQKASKVVDVDYCGKNGIDIVRRITGGKMVLHHKEVTYSVCSSDEEIFPPNLAGSYSLVSQALMRGLERMGLHPCLADSSPDFYARGDLPCFSYPARNEVEVMGKKIIGSAQKRVGSKFLQHGSIPLEEDEELLQSVSTLPEKSGNIRMISIHEAVGKKVSFDWVVEHLEQGFSEFFGVRFRLKTFSSDEMDAIRHIQTQKYENPSWTFSHAGVRLS